LVAHAVAKVKPTIPNESRTVSAVFAKVAVAAAEKRSRAGPGVAGEKGIRRQRLN
jgi:hypothetical protein